jgi:hypothetical protein
MTTFRMTKIPADGVEGGVPTMANITGTGR